MTVKDIIQFVIDNKLDMDIEVKIVRYGISRSSALIMRDPNGNPKKRYLEISTKVKE